MSATISIDDFGGDIVDSIKPIANALGLLDSNGNLDINDWNFNKAVGVLSTYERTEIVLDLLTSMIGMPEIQYRQKEYIGSPNTASGLLFESKVGDAQNYDEEEWFRVYPVSSNDVPWAVYLTVVHEKGDEILSTGTHYHDIRLGIGFSLEQEIGDELLTLRASIPLLNVSTSSATNTNSDEQPPIGTDFLFWSDEGLLGISERSEARPSVSARLSRGSNANSNRYAVTPGSDPSCEAIHLQFSIGKQGTSTDSAVKLVLTLEDFKETSNSTGSDKVLDSWNDGNGLISNIANSVLPMVLNLIPNGIIKDHLLPMMGLTKPQSTLTQGGTEDINWPTIDLIGLLSNIPDTTAMMDDLRIWVEQIGTTRLGEWLAEFYALLTGNVATISGSGTEVDPSRLELYFSNDIGLYFLACKRTDANSNEWFDFGLSVSLTRTIGTTYTIVGGIDAWLLSIPLNTTGGLDLFRLFELNMHFDNTAGPLVSWGGDTQANGFDAYDGEIGSARLALVLDSNRRLAPAIELLNVDLGTTHWDVLDLTSADAAQEILDGFLASTQEAISEVLADGGFLQRLCALIGLVAPRSASFRYAMYEQGHVYSTGDRIREGNDVWGVSVGGPCDAASIPSGSGTIIVGTTDTIELAYLGNRPSLALWETGDSSDLRIDLLELIKDPLGAISRYHRDLQTTMCPNSTGTSHENIPAWAYLFEALGELVVTVISVISGDPEPPVFGDEDLLSEYTSGSGINSYTHHLTPGNVYPSVALVAQYDTSTRHLSLSILSMLAQRELGSSLMLSVSVNADMVQFLLPDPSVVDDVTTAELLKGASFDVELSSSQGPSERIELFNFGGMVMDLKAVSAGLEWVRGTGIGWYFEISEPYLGGLYPDLPALFSSATKAQLSLMSGISWNGVELRLPDGAIVAIDRNQITETDSGGNITDQTGSTSIGFNFNDGNYSSMTIDITSFGLVTNSDISFRSLSGSGITGLIGGFLPSVSSAWDLLISDEIRILLGQLLANKCGQIGLFFTAFFKLNPLVLHLDLGNYLEGTGLQQPTYTLPSQPVDWLTLLGTDPRCFGLGPYALPLDWPEINWQNLIQDPLPTLRNFLVSLFNSSSISGEPFALPALRWIWGLLSGNLPDMRKSDLGWKQIVENAIDTVEIPDVPVEIQGSGTYANPWAIGLSLEGFPKIELLVWLDPDGLPRASGADEITHMLSTELLEVLQQTTSVQNANLPTDWTQQVASMLIQLSQHSPRVAHAVDHMTSSQIDTALQGLVAFLQDSDGYSTIASQEDTNGNWASQQGQTHIANHLNALNTDSVIADAIQFISGIVTSTAPTSWKLVLVSPDWMGLNAWDDFIAEAGTEWSGMTQLSGAELDLASLGPMSISDINFLDISSHDASSQIHTLIPTLSAAQNDSITEVLAHQVRALVDHITSDGSIAFLVGHSIGGLAVRYYTEGLATQGTTPDSQVGAAVTIATPHDIDISAQLDIQGIETIVHLMRLIGAIQHDHQIAPSSVPMSITSGTTHDNISTETLSQLATFIAEFGGDL